MYSIQYYMYQTQFNINKESFKILKKLKIDCYFYVTVPVLQTPTGVVVLGTNHPAVVPSIVCSLDCIRSSDTQNSSISSSDLTIDEWNG